MSDIGTTRRIQAMLWWGRTPGDIAEEIGSTHDNVLEAAFGDPGNVDPDSVRHTYRRTLFTTKPEDNEFSKLALENNWNGPGAWDDIDDPDASPELNIHPSTTPREMMRDIKTRNGWSNKKLSFEFGVSRQVVRETLMGRRNRLYSSRYFDTREAYLRALECD
jgi:hypothetical protein